MILVNHKSLNLPQIGDVAVLDISATTMDQDEVQKIPSAESKGLPVCTEDYTHSVRFFVVMYAFPCSTLHSACRFSF
jgi:hypothetical protein